MYRKMFYVYILKSKSFPKRIYIGFSEDIKTRLNEHNSGKVKSTNKFKPWNIETYISFSQKNLAIAFEKYLKKGSGHAFIRKRLINNKPITNI